MVGTATKRIFLVVRDECCSDKSDEGIDLMSEIESKQEQRTDFSPLQIFFIKTATVTCAAIVLLFSARSFLDSWIDSRAEQLKILNGGPAFWHSIENGLYSLAEEPDLPPEKKKKILAALRRMSLKYGPYLEALTEPSKGSN